MSSSYQNEQIKIDSLDELMQNEHQILERIEQVPNGGKLFFIHPFRLFKDIGVILTEKAIKEVIDYEPRFTGLSDWPYDALKSSEEKQTVTIHLTALFRNHKQ